MKIAVISPYPPSQGTLNEYAYHFVRALRQKPEVDDVVVLSDELPGQESYPPHQPRTSGQAGLRIIPCWRFNARRNIARIVHTIHHVKPDVVLFNIQFASFGGRKRAATMGLMAPLAVKALGIPVVVLLHNIMETVDLKSAGYADSELMERMIRLFGNLTTRMVLAADRVALTIPKYVEILNAKYHADNVILTPHGSFEETKTQPSFALPAGVKQIMAFGKFGTYKRVETLIEAFERLQTAGRDDIELVIAGSDSPNAQGYLATVAERYAANPAIRFTGYVPETAVARTFREAAVVVFPYTSTTGSSGVLHQAGSYGKAAVLPKIGDLAEVIEEEGYAGEFFTPGDSQSLATAIAKVLDNPEYAGELGKRNFLASQGLPIHEVVDWYLLHFEQLLAEKEKGKVRLTVGQWLPGRRFIPKPLSV
ncbi:MAG TPA: glycosyltransferase [Caldilineaceae bacterium]|nr:glycosyltransferase [Caldilineaceae bacterium]